MRRQNPLVTVSLNMVCYFFLWAGSVVLSPFLFSFLLFYPVPAHPSLSTVTLYFDDDSSLDGLSRLSASSIPLFTFTFPPF